MKKCKACRQPFTPARPLQCACSPECAYKLVKKANEKKASEAKKVERKRDAETRVRLKSRQKWLKEAEAVVNKYVRLRDANQPCISCDRPASWSGQWHASHFRSVGAASAVRFNLWNIHKACSICNNHKSGNLSEYEPRLRLKIGDEKVDWLRAQNQVANYSIEYLSRLKQVMNRKVKRYESRR